MVLLEPQTNTTPILKEVSVNLAGAKIQPNNIMLRVVEDYLRHIKCLKHLIYVQLIYSNMF